MSNRQIVHQVSIAPGPHTAATIGRDVVGTPASLYGACKFMPVVQRKKQISRRMALTTVFHGLDQVGTPIPIGAALNVGCVALVRIKQERPQTHEAALVKRKDQGI